MKNIEDALFKLVTAGLEENNTCSFSEDVDWLKVFKIANMQGVAAICLDGLQKLNQKIVVPYPIKMQWIYNPQIQISAESGTKRSIFRQKNKTKRSKKRLHTTLIKPEQKVNEDLCSGFIVS